MWEKTYTLTKEQQLKVDKIVAEGNEKYKDILHIEMVSEYDMSIFFEHEIEEC